MEKETRANELLRGFDEMFETGSPPFDMSDLKDRNRDLIWLLLEKVDAGRDRKYIPLLEAWMQVDCKKVRVRIGRVIDNLDRDVT